MELGLRGARVVVTGGGANIGRGIALGFAREGASVMVVDIDGEHASQVSREVAGKGAEDSFAGCLDLSLPGAGDQMVSAATQRWGGVDVLVNNAGWCQPGWFVEQQDRDVWWRTVEANLFTAVACTQAVLPVMQAARRGSVIFLASEAATGALRQGIYGATKAGIISLARTVAREHGRDGIRSNVVAPGLVVPEPGAAMGPHSLWAGGTGAIFTENQIESVLQTQPLRRSTTTADVAFAVMWLASERVARQVTGQVVAVGGGSMMP